MTVQPWRATCIQTKSKLAVKAADRAGAWTIINDNIAHVIGLIEAAARGADPPDLVVLPEFSLQGPPHGLPAAALATSLRNMASAGVIVDEPEVPIKKRAGEAR